MGAMCTVVVRWSPEQPVQILALRDELRGRDFDDPGRWWPEHPDVVGGRDRVAGGTWCASRLTTGATALVLNRPQKRLADPGAPSRGVLPLLAVMHEDGWKTQVDLLGMASFALVLATPRRLTCWVFDGDRLDVTELGAGTHMVTSGGAEDGKTDRYLPEFQHGSYPQDWQAAVQRAAPQDDPAALVIRHEQDGKVFATVFGELIDARPGHLRLHYSRHPWTGTDWQTLALG
jgi:hypothetical protein